MHAALPADASLAATYRRVRGDTVSLADGLTDEDCGAQAMPDASPVKWHLAHTTWFFETFVLARFESGFRACDPAFLPLFNSYYESIGTPYPRSRRGLLTRPALREVLDWRAQVDARMACLLAPDLPGELIELAELGIQHEQQHQELICTDLLALLSLNPLKPAARPGRPAPCVAQPLRWLDAGGGLVQVGHDGQGFGFDNERPRHSHWLQAFAVASRLVSNGEFAEFIAAGGYAQPLLWLSDGWAWRQSGAREAPLYWRADSGRGWMEFSLQGEHPLDLHAPLRHVSLYEADAYARWAGARLPTEAEWEHAVRTQPIDDAFGACWQWTSSAYARYPGYQPAAGAVGEYNGKFMVNQQVLRGASAFTPAGHARVSYRNFFPAGACWQMAGVRLVR